jgi:hypothetical protein
MATLFDDASLVMIPSGYKDDKLYSIKPTSGDGDFTFSRDGSGASPATRVNSAGLIEKGRTNLLLQSNQFDTTWTNTSTTETSGQSGYDGTNNAWLLSKSAAFGRINQSISLSGVHTFSVYAKEGTSGWMRLVVIGTANPSAYFNLSSGAVGTTANIIESNSENIGNGWYRYSISLNQASISEVRIYPAEADNDIGATSGNIYIQDAQLEKGLVATSYIETTTAAASAGILGDMPRLDYSGGATCPSLLLEPARTNLIMQSEYLGAAYWTKSACSITDNATTSPEGVLNAVKLVENTANAAHQVQHPAITIGNTNYASSSFYIKAGERSVAVVNLSNVTLSGNVWKFDLTAETATLVSVGTGWANQSASITSAGNGWYRCVVSGQLTSTATQVYTQIRLNNGTSTSYLGDGTSGFYLYGAQVEASSYPTSYVPTYGSATARAADSCSKTGISSLIGQTEGTLFLDYETENAEDNGRLIAIGDGSTNNRILLRNQGSGTLLYVAAGGSSTWSTTYYVPGNTGRIKIGLGYANNDGILFVNGSSVNSDTSVTVPACSNVYIGTSEYGGAEDTNIKVNQALLFKTRLTNSELESLTTL